MRRFLLILTALILLVAGVFIVLVLTLDEDRAKRLIYAQVEARTGQELTIAGDLKWRLFPVVALEAREIRLSNPPGFAGPDMLEAGQLRASVRLLPLLRREIRIGDVVVEDAVARLITDVDGRSNLERFLEGEPVEPGAPSPDLTTGRVRLSNVTLEISDEVRGTRDQYRIDDLQFDRFAFDRPVAFVFRGGLGEPPVLEDMSASGRLLVPLDRQAVRISDLELTGILAGAALKVNLGGEVSLESSPLVVELSDGHLALAEQTFSVNFGYRHAPPHVEAELRGELLDLDQLLEGLPEASDEPHPPPDDHALAFLRHMDLDAALSLDRLVVSGMTVSGVDARAKSREGVLIIEPLTGILAGGRLDARAEIDLRPVQPVVRIEPRFELDDFGEALAPWGLQDRLAGSGRLSLTLDTRSLNPAIMLDQLRGEGRYELADGVFRGLDFGALVGAAQERDLVRAAGEAVGGQTPFNLLAGRLEIGEGVLVLPEIRLRSDEFGIDGQLTISLSDLDLDGRLRMDQPRLERLPLKLDGTLDSPRLGIAAEDAIRQEGERRMRDWLQRRLEREPEPEDEDKP